MLHCFNIQKEQSCFEEYDHMKLYENKVIFFYLIELKNQLCIQVPLQITLIKTWKLLRHCLFTSKYLCHLLAGQNHLVYVTKDNSNFQTI